MARRSSIKASSAMKISSASAQSSPSSAAPLPLASRSIQTRCQHETGLQPILFLERLHQKAIGIMQIVAMTGLSDPAVRAWIDLFHAGGWSAIRPALRGRSKGVGRILSQVQEDTIQCTILPLEPGSRWPTHRAEVRHQAARAQRRQGRQALGLDAAKAHQASL
uniref:Uncharacterized protein n=1 Tax=mine drainage metagenome TaxID=410659 RepID=E6PQN6_9ZZZZ